MSDNNVKDLPLGSDATQRLVIAAIEKYVAAMTPPSDQAEKQLWDQVVQTELSVNRMSVDASGMPVAVAHSVKDAVAAANDVITERRKFFSGRSGEQN
jgi:HD-like signal output (HDOD) protein